MGDWRAVAFGGASAASGALTLGEAPAPIAEPKSVLEMLHDVLTFLERDPDRGLYTAEQLAANAGVTWTPELDAKVRSNIKVAVADDGRLSYRAAFEATCMEDVLRVIESSPGGVLLSEIKDAYPDAATDAGELLRSGRALGVRHLDKELSLFSRGLPLLVPLGGSWQLAGPRALRCSESPHVELRRGDVVVVSPSGGAGGGGPEEYFRVDGGTRALGGLAVSAASVEPSNKHASTAATLAIPEGGEVPLDRPCSLPVGAAVSVRKHGFTNDVRKLWADTLAQLPTDRDRLDQRLVDEGIKSQADVERDRAVKKAAKRARGPGREKRRNRYRKRQAVLKPTNDHMLGTELGSILSGVGGA